MRATTVRSLALAPILVLIGGCTGVPDGVSVVNGFELQRYLGAWYEIARLDHRFERGLTDVKAEYSLKDNGRIEVINRGFDTNEGEWREALGKAYAIGEAGTGRLKVSFFGPFYGAYNIIELDKQDYSYAMVSGPDRSYLWILARQRSLDQAVLDRLVKKAASLGFDTGELIYVTHGRSP